MDERIKKLVAAVFDVDPASVTPESAPSTIDRWDSLGQMTLMLALEDEFGIQFDEDQMTASLDVRAIEIMVAGMLTTA